MLLSTSKFKIIFLFNTHLKLHVFVTLSGRLSPTMTFGQKKGSTGKCRFSLKQIVLSFQSTWCKSLTPHIDCVRPGLEPPPRYWSFLAQLSSPDLFLRAREAAGQGRSSVCNWVTSHYISDLGTCSKCTLEANSSIL